MFYDYSRYSVVQQALKFINWMNIFLHRVIIESKPFRILCMFFNRLCFTIFAVEEMYAAMSTCQQLHPDSNDDDSDGKRFFSGYGERDGLSHLVYKKKVLYLS